MTAEPSEPRARPRPALSWSCPRRGAVPLGVQLLTALLGLALPDDPPCALGRHLAGVDLRGQVGVIGQVAGECHAASSRAVGDPHLLGNLCHCGTGVIVPGSLAVLDPRRTTVVAGCCPRRPCGRILPPRRQTGGAQRARGPGLLLAGAGC